MFGVRRWFASIVLVALSVTAGASATISHDAAIDPGQRVGGMLVVQGIESDADLSIWTYCNPIVTAPGPEARTCSVPRSRRTSPDTESGESREGSSMRLGTSERGRCGYPQLSRTERVPVRVSAVRSRLGAARADRARGRGRPRRDDSSRVVSTAIDRHAGRQSGFDAGGASSSTSASAGSTPSRSRRADSRPGRACRLDLLGRDEHVRHRDARRRRRAIATAATRT